MWLERMILDGIKLKMWEKIIYVDIYVIEGIILDHHTVPIFSIDLLSFLFPILIWEQDFCFTIFLDEWEFFHSEESLGIFKKVLISLRLYISLVYICTLYYENR